jgi:DNA helicase HerA-like ATPase
MDINITDIFCVLGKRGSGKSEIAKHFIRQMQNNDYPILILDINNEYKQKDFPYVDIFQGKSITDYVENYDREIDKFISKNNSGMIIFEDVDVLVSSTSIPMPILDLVIRGRHKNIGCMFLFRRAANIHKQILYNSHHIFIPRLNLPNDIEYLANYIPDSETILPYLNKYEFLEYETDEGTLQKVKLNLANDVLEVVE